MMAHKTKEHYGASTVEWVNVNYNIVIRRRPSYYLLTFVLPCFMITTISIIGIFSPFNDAGDREEKVTMGLTTLLTMTIVVTLIADKMPKSSEGMPLLGIYVMLQIGIGAMSSFLTVIVMHLNRKWTFGEPVPNWILIITRFVQEKGNPSSKKQEYFGHRCKRDKSIKANDDSADANGNKQETTIFKNIESMVSQIIEHLYEAKEEEALRKNWQRASQRLDLLLMIVFLVINCILTVSFLAIGYLNL